MTHRNAIIAAGLGLLLLAPAARAGTGKLDAQMQPLHKEYSKIHAALAGDSTDGIDRAAAKIKKLAGKLDPSVVTGKHAGHYRGLPKKIAAAAGKLRAAKGIKAKREAFKGLSKPLAMWATMSRPKGVNVLFCSMARGSWLQGDGEKIANPYYGARMLRCGEVVSGKDKGKAGGHMKHMKKNHEH